MYYYTALDLATAATALAAAAAARATGLIAAGAGFLPLHTAATWPNLLQTLQPVNIIIYLLTN